MPKPPRLGAHEIFGGLAEPGALVSNAILGVFFLAFALLVLALTGKL
jgi:hypothetical protein